MFRLGWLVASVALVLAGSLTPCWSQAPTASQLQAILASGPTGDDHTLATTAYKLSAQAVQTNGGDVSATTWTALGATSSRSMAARGSDLLNIMDYGAKCDGITDDAAAIQTTIALARAKINSGLPARLVLGSGRCLFNSSLNFTGLVSYIAVIDGSQSLLICNVQNAACLDATGSAHIKWDHLHLTTTGVHPTIGLQIMRATESQPCGEQRLLEPVIIGNFVMAPLYDGACESTTFIDPHFENTSTASQSYAAIFDGANHWNVPSTYLQSTWAQDLSNSFNENTTFGGTFVSHGGSLIWIEAASRHRFYGSYGLSLSTAPSFVLFVPHPGNTIVDLSVDMHLETAPSSIFLIAGTEANPTIKGLSYSDHLCQATSSIISGDTNISSIKIVDSDFKVPQLYTSPRLVADPSMTSMSGMVRIPGSAWNLASGMFSGMAEIDGIMTSYAATIPASSRTTLTTSGYTVPASTNLVRMVQSASVSASVIKLPPSPIDGMYIQFDNYAGAVNALSFSPSVFGWTNTSTLAAYSALRIRWDAGSGSWFREQ